MSNHPLITLGISACLLGRKVRFNGGHKRCAFIADVLPHYFSLIPICPETAIGMGVPREPIRLVQRGYDTRAVGAHTKTLDVTDSLSDCGHAFARQNKLSGFIFKKGSPSCGMDRVKLYNENGHPAGHSTGIFAQTIMTDQPLLPCEEEGRLNDPRLRESFFKRVYLYYHWQQLAEEGITPAGLIRFHTDHKFTLLAHDETRYRKLGRLVADVTPQSIHDISKQYIALAMAILQQPTSRPRHSNVLLHISGFLKNKLAPEDKQELLAAIESYAKGHIPLIVPMTLINHLQRLYRNDYLARQRYLKPYPPALQLYNMV